MIFKPRIQDKVFFFSKQLFFLCYDILLGYRINLRKTTGFV